jgi:hypothetical protein
MDFRIRGLDPAPFARYFRMDEAELARHRAARRIADEKPGFPCRVSLADVDPGHPVILVNYEHLAVESPYRASHAIFVGPAQEPFDEIGIVPPALRERLLSVRAFDASGMMVDADVAEGRDVEPLVARMLGRTDVAYLHAHFARRGCFAARIERAD